VTDDEKKLQIDEQLRFADGLLGRGHHTLAIEEYQRLIRQFPDDPLVADAWMQLAEAHATQGRDDAARRLYEEFLRKFPAVPTRSAAEVNYARLLLRSARPGDRDRGGRLLDDLKARQDVPEMIREAARYYRACDLATTAEGQATARRELRTLAALPVTDATRHRFRAFAVTEIANLLLQEGQPEEALRLLAPLATATAVPPEIQNTVLQMTAAIHWNTGDFVRAAEAYGQLGLLFPDSDAGREAPVRRLEALYRTKDGRTLIREAELLLAKPEAMPYRDRILFLQAATLQEEGFYGTAAVAYAELATVGTDNETVQKAAFQQVSCLRQDGKGEAAVAAAARSWLGHRKLSPETMADIVLLAAEPPMSAATAMALLREAATAVAEPRARARILLRLAGAELAAGHPADALPHYRDAAAAGTPEIRGFAQIGLATCLEALGKLDEAVAAYREMLADEALAEPVAADASLRLALLFLRQPDRWDEAQAELERLAKRHPESLAARQADFYLGYLELARRDHAAAVARLATLLRRRDLAVDLRLDATAYYLWALLELGRDEEVHRGLGPLFADDAFLSRAPAEFLLRVGEHHLRRDPELAMIAFTQVGEAEPALHQRAMLGRGIVHAGRGETDLAMAALREAATAAADPAVSCQAHARLGELLVTAGKPDQAIIHFERALDNPQAPDAAARARLGLARVLATQDDRLASANRHAMAVFILGADPDLCVEAMLLSVRLSLRQGRPDEAASTWRELRHRFPDALGSDEARQTADLLRAAGPGE
jgi:tetratricopeptide (TPR) repeat protein